MRIELFQSREKARLVSQNRRRVMIRMPSLPIGKNNYPRSRLPDHAGHIQSVLPRVLDPAVRNVESPPPRHPQNLRSVIGLALAVFCRPAGPHLALGQIENAGDLSALRSFQQRPAASLLYIVAVGGDGKDVERSTHVNVVYQLLSVSSFVLFLVSTSLL